ncbi:MAG: carbon-nitrogen hydrolase family protein [Rhizobiaceae bacterium]|nr:carbon-nitrogen hydrolase family protein [Rhizobiaceae bacterium]
MEKLARSTVIGICALLLFISQPAANGTEKSLRVAAIQLAASDAGNFTKMRTMAQNAKAQGAALVIYPESSAFGWLNPESFAKATPIPGALEAQFSAIARDVGVWVATSIAELGPPIGTDGKYHQPYDTGILIDPTGKLVLRHRKYNVLQNAFTKDECPPESGDDGCEYATGDLADLAIADTPFGRTAILVCADAYTYDTTTLSALKKLTPEFVIIPWGITAGSREECGTPGFNATGYAADAAKFLGDVVVVGANATGERPYGRYLPSWYCGTSGYATSAGVGAVADGEQELFVFDVPVE